MRIFSGGAADTVAKIRTIIRFWWFWHATNESMQLPWIRAGCKAYDRGYTEKIVTSKMFYWEMKTEHIWFQLNHKMLHDWVNFIASQSLRRIVSSTCCDIYWYAFIDFHSIRPQVLVRKYQRLIQLETVHPWFLNLVHEKQQQMLEAFIFGLLLFFSKVNYVN